MLSRAVKTRSVAKQVPFARSSWLRRTSSDIDDVRPAFSSGSMYPPRSCSLSHCGTLSDGAALPVTGNVPAKIVLPGGRNGPAYLATENYEVILRWNRSQYFATAVGTLADRIAGR